MAERSDNFEYMFRQMMKEIIKRGISQFEPGSTTERKVTMDDIFNLFNSFKERAQGATEAVEVTEEEKSARQAAEHIGREWENLKRENELLREQIEILRLQMKDKDELIELLKEQSRLKTKAATVRKPK